MTAFSPAVLQDTTLSSTYSKYFHPGQCFLRVAVWLSGVGYLTIWRTTPGWPHSLIRHLSKLPCRRNLNVRAATTSRYDLSVSLSGRVVNRSKDKFLWRRIIFNIENSQQRVESQPEFNANHCIDFINLVTFLSFHES